MTNTVPPPQNLHVTHRAFVTRVIWPQRRQGDRQQGETRQMQWQSKDNKRKDKATNARKERKLGLATKKGKLRPKIKAITMGVKIQFLKCLLCLHEE